jgi:hypothetical protein
MTEFGSETAPGIDPERLGSCAGGACAVGAPMLMARSGHTSARSLAKYARVSAEVLQRDQAERDPARRR